ACRGSPDRAAWCRSGREWAGVSEGVERRHVLARAHGEARRTLLQERRDALVGGGRGAPVLESRRTAAGCPRVVCAARGTPHFVARGGRPAAGGVWRRSPPASARAVGKSTSRS